MIESWPVSSETAESLLVHKEGDYVVYLNELKYKKDSALKLKLDIKNYKNLPAAMAVLGKTGLIEGNDYRNVPVLSYVKAIPNTPWYIIAKEDKKEIFNSLRKTIWIRITLTLLFILGAGFLLLMFWQRQDAVYKEKEIKAKMERLVLEKHFDYLTKYANDIIILADADYNIIEINDRALDAYGYNRQELLEMNIRDIRRSDEIFQNEEFIQSNKNNQELFEAKHYKKDGSFFIAEVSARKIIIEEKVYFQEIIRDITERKSAEESLRESEERFSKAFRISPYSYVIVNMKDGAVIEVNDAFTSFSGFTREEVLASTTFKLKLWVNEEIGCAW